jgi:hypothetical protein
MEYFVGKREKNIMKMTQPLTPENISRLHASLSPEAQSEINKMCDMIVDEYASLFREKCPEEKKPKFGREQAKELIYVLVSRGLL